MSSLLVVSPIANVNHSEISRRRNKFDEKVRKGMKDIFNMNTYIGKLALTNYSKSNSNVSS